MKIIEALKTIKANKEKIGDLTRKIKENSAILSNQTSPYGGQKDATKVVSGWLDSVRQILRENEILTKRIHQTNNITEVSVTLADGTTVTKTIDEWLTRRKDGVAAHKVVYSALTDRGLREEFITQPNGERVPVTIVRHFDAAARDSVLSLLSDEVLRIDSALEIVNATTDLVE